MAHRDGGVMVLLSAYNGAQFIAEQIESIRAQSFKDWSLVIRDDRSTDDTVRIVDEFCALDPRISLVRYPMENLGPWESFGLLLAHAHEVGSEYVFISDQDDVWLEDKMERQLALLRRGPDETPILVHSDLILVNSTLEPQHDSFSETQRVSYDADDPLGTLLIHNAVVGCTIAINGALLELGVPIPPRTMHDWWLASCAAASGSIRRTDEPTVLYRQHSSNYVGVEPRRAFLKELIRHPLSFSAEAFRSFTVSVDQAKQLRERLSARGVDGKSLERVERYCDAFSDERGLIGRLRALGKSQPKPRRTTSKIILRALAAAYPWGNRVTASSSSTNGYDNTSANPD